MTDRSRAQTGPLDRAWRTLRVLRWLVAVNLVLTVVNLLVLWVRWRS